MDKPKLTKMLSVRVPVEDADKVKILANWLKRKSPYVKEADVIRELIGFISTGLITKEMRAWLAQPGATLEMLDRVSEVPHKVEVISGTGDEIEEPHRASGK